MRGVGRSFWTLVTIVGLVEGLLVYLAIRSLDHVLPCWSSAPAYPIPSTESCGESVALFGYNSWVPAVVILGFVTLSLTAGLVTFVSQIIRTNRALRQLGSPIPSPERLVRVERALGADVALIDDARCFCCCSGLIHPRILISSGMLNRLEDNELSAVLAHEQSHVLRRDPARAAAVRVAASAMLYLPLARHLAKKALIASELAADARATSVVGQDDLVGALLKVIGQIRPALGTATEMASLDSLDSRIEALRTKRLPRVRPTPSVVVASFLATASIYGMSTWLPPTVNRVIHQPILHVRQQNPTPGIQRTHASRIGLSVVYESSARVTGRPC